MTVVVYLIHLMIGSAGVVHQHHIVGIEVFGACANLLVELLWSICLWLANALAALLGCPCEGLGGLSVGHHQHVIHGLELIYLDGLKLLQAGSLLALLAQQDACLAQLTLEVSVELRGEVAHIGLRHHVLRHESVLGHQVGHTRVGTSVGERILEEPSHHLAVDVLLARIYHSLKEEVALLQLVVEEEIHLTEEEVTHSQCAHGAVAQHVGARKEPASAAALLVADARVLHLGTEVSVLGLAVVLVECQLLYAGSTHGIPQCLLGGRGAVAAFEGLQYVPGNA